MRAIFLDRDGVICENRSDYVKSWQEFEFLPGAIQGLVTLSHLNLPIIVVTNQSAVGRGVISIDTLEEIHRRMVAEITAWGGRIDRVFYCPHRPGEGCGCRKPQPGMLRQAAHELGLELDQSYMVGDAATDLAAGQAVGCKTFMVLTGRGRQQLTPAFRSVKQPFVITRSLFEAANHIVKTERQRTLPLDSWKLPRENHRHPLPLVVK